MRPKALILGIDLATAKGKPIAMTIVRFDEEARTVVYHSARRITGKYIRERMGEWAYVFQRMLVEAKRFGGLDMVAIEDARPRGRGGANMQYLCQVLKDRALVSGLRVELIHPSTVKKIAAGRGNASTEEVSIMVRAEYKMSAVPITVGEHDLEMATAIAGAGYAILQQEALEAL